MQQLSLMILLAPLLLLDSQSLARSFFDSPPTQVTIHNPKSTEGLPNRTTITVVVPDNAGNSLESIVLRQLPNIDHWDWGRSEPTVYLGKYSLRRKGASGLASVVFSETDGELIIRLNPVVQPGQTVNVVFRGFNPYSSVYQWSTELMADGEDPVRYQGPTLRLNVYKSDPFR